jgi:hypothetical protein
MDSTKKPTGTRYAELVFLHPVGPAGHVVHSGASEARNGYTLFLMLWWDWFGCDKKASRHITLNSCFSIRWDIRVT